MGVKIIFGKLLCNGGVEGDARSRDRKYRNKRDLPVSVYGKQDWMFDLNYRSCA